jgi:RHS repeat-associated protein
MVAIDEKSMPSLESIRRRTRPLVNNLYQGMTLDAVTGLYYERARDYSPSLGRWMEPDPAQFINGANTYQFVNSSPVGNVDAQGEPGAPGGSGRVAEALANLCAAVRAFWMLNREIGAARKVAEAAVKRCQCGNR